MTTSEREVVALFVAANPIPQATALDPVQPLDVTDLDRRTGPGGPVVDLRDAAVPGGPSRWRLVPLVAAVVVALVGLAILVDPLPREVEPASPVEVAESFMDAWVNGDGEAAATMLDTLRFDALSLWIGDYTYIEPERLPALHDWYRAVGWEYHNRGCGLLRFGLVSCNYTAESFVTRAQTQMAGATGPEPAVGNLLFKVDEGAIERVWDGGVPADAVVHAWYLFQDWVWRNHPAGYPRMYDGFAPRLDDTSIALWEQHTTTFLESAATPEALRRWQEGEVTIGPWFPQPDDGTGAAFSDTAVSQICRVATHRFEAEIAESIDTEVWTLEDIARFHATAARYSQEALSELENLPPEELDRTSLEPVFLLMEQQTDLLQRIATAAAGGDAEYVETLLAERIRVTDAKDDAGGPEFWHCPIGSLGA